MFWYDGLQQVTQRQRGTLVPTTPLYTTYRYDALYRRIAVEVGSTHHDYYYADAWQVSGF